MTDKVHCEICKKVYRPDDYDGPQDANEAFINDHAFSPADELSTRLLQSIAIQAGQIQPLVSGLVREERETLRQIDTDLSDLLDWLQNN